jgi:ABC-2 type transport system permease protein
VSMLLRITAFELGYYLRRISTHVYFLIFFACAFGLMTLAGGQWQGVQMAVGGSGGNVNVDSPYVLLILTATLALFGVIVTAALLGNAIYRDYESGMHPLFFTTPVPRLAYLGGRFLGAALVNVYILLSIPLGFMAARPMPYMDAEKLGAFRAASFFQPILVLGLPNLLLTGAIFFVLAATTRTMLPNYVGAVFLLVGYLLAGQLTQDLENERLAALLDPFGLNAVTLATKYWTPVERNTTLLALEGVFLHNRLIWMGVGLLVLAIGFARFRFAHLAGEGRGWRRRRRGAAQTVAAAEAAPTAALHAPTVIPAHGAATSLAQLVTLGRRSFREIVASRYFFAIVGAGLAFLVLSAGEVGKLYGTTTWPVTYQVLELLGGTFGLFILIVISFYAGELVWRERDVKIQQVQDALPVRTWVPFVAKLLALCAMVALLLGVVLLAGVATQAFRGYTNFELGLYLRWLFLFDLPDYLLLVALVLVVHVLANHKYMGHLIVVLYFVSHLFAGQLGLEHNLYLFGSDAGRTYSDMNGFGPFAEPFYWFKAYWAAWALLFALASNLFWVRGQESGARWRVRMARARFGRRPLGAAALALVLILGLGGFVFYNTNVLNDFSTSKAAQRRTAEYERLYKQYEDAAQPRITAVHLHVELYPERGDLEVRGSYRLVNREAVPIDSLHLRLPRQIEIRSMEFGRPAAVAHSDERHGYHIYRLERPLAPGDSLTLEFDLAFVSRGFENRVTHTSVVENGTFVNSGMMPSFGYDPRAEISDDAQRRKHGLPPRERMPRLEDEDARRNTYVSRDADWIDFEAVVGTAPDQIALAPGYLQREWTENGRRYFHYRMDAPILNFYSFLSARYEVHRDRWVDPASGETVAIEIYYHPGHEYNLERMTASVQRSLDYFTREFGPYQYRQVRILEFPRYARFAQAFPNTIPYSEAIGFIARMEKEEDVDYPFYVTSHEVAHQWWAHQVIGANVQGATVLSETLSQYSALMVMEKEYGEAQMKKFLKYELDRYLSGRGFERRKELPLLRDEGQGYIHYQKGSLVMYALRDYLGEERLNGAIRAFLEEHRFSQPPYPTSADLLRHLRAATPDSLQYVLTDMFEEITLYDNRVVEARATPEGDGRWRVTLEIEARKVRADSLGNETEVPMNDLVDIGVFAAPEGRRGEGAPLYLAKHRITSGLQRVEVVVQGEPHRAGVDPLHKLIDRITSDNTVSVRR